MKSGDIDKTDRAVFVFTSPNLTMCDGRGRDVQCEHYTRND